MLNWEYLHGDSQLFHDQPFLRWERGRRGEEKGREGMIPLFQTLSVMVTLLALLFQIRGCAPVRWYSFSYDKQTHFQSIFLFCLCWLCLRMLLRNVIEDKGILEWGEGNRRKDREGKKEEGTLSRVTSSNMVNPAALKKKRNSVDVSYPSSSVSSINESSVLRMILMLSLTRIQLMRKRWITSWMTWRRKEMSINIPIRDGREFQSISFPFYRTPSTVRWRHRFVNGEKLLLATEFPIWQQPLLSSLP